MFLKKLNLVNFKNCSSTELDFSEGVNCFTGNNGAGKTNLLDAIHYLSLCKSYFNPIDSQQVKHGEDFFVIQGVFDRKGKVEHIYCGLKKHQKKQFKKNKKEYTRLADHIGYLPLVMISPYDTFLISEGSEERRKFMDGVISQTDLSYLDSLIAYNKILVNRNALLKQMYDSRSFDPDMLSVYDEQLAAHGDILFEKRKTFMESFLPVFREYYKYISNENEEVGLEYNSSLKEQDMLTLLKKSVDRDRVLQRTSAGIHKDELEFTIHAHPLKKLGSQGQQKSFLIALKLAQYQFIKESKKLKPLLLLDDIFDKLDETRVQKLMEMVVHETFGQIFITDTHPERLKTIFDTIQLQVRVYQVNNGIINPAN